MSDGDRPKNAGLLQELFIARPILALVINLLIAVAGFWQSFKFLSMCGENCPTLKSGRCLSVNTTLWTAGPPEGPI